MTSWKVGEWKQLMSWQAVRINHLGTMESSRTLVASVRVLDEERGWWLLVNSGILNSGWVLLFITSYLHAWRLWEPQPMFLSTACCWQVDNRDLALQKIRVVQFDLPGNSLRDRHRRWPYFQPLRVNEGSFPSGACESI